MKYKMSVCEVLSVSCVQPQSMAEVLAKKEELAERLEKANEEAIASAIAEEEQLNREIEAENSELDTDNESEFSVRIMMFIYTGNVCTLCDRKPFFVFCYIVVC